jgi:hypothetical protein
MKIRILRAKSFMTLSLGALLVDSIEERLIEKGFLAKSNLIPFQLNYQCLQWCNDLRPIIFFPSLNNWP